LGWEHIADQVLEYYRELRAEQVAVWGRQIARQPAAAVRAFE
jgi:hypothetical protein